MVGRNVQLQDGLALRYQREGEREFTLNNISSNHFDFGAITEKRSSSEIPNRLGGSGRAIVELNPIFSSMSLIECVPGVCRNSQSSLPIHPHKSIVLQMKTSCVTHIDLR